MGASSLFKGALVLGALAALVVLAASAATPTITPMGAVTPGCQGVAIEGDLACVVGGPAGIVTYDISDPSAPTQIGAAPLEENARALALADGQAVIAARDAGLLIYDLVSSSSPVLLGKLETEGYAEDVAIHDGLAYVAAEWGGFAIADIADPAAPTALASLSDVKPALGVHLVFDEYARLPALAYVACGAEGLYVVDVSEPYLPQVVAHCEIPDTVTDITVQGDYGYVANMKGVAVIDLADPLAPRALVTLETHGWSMAVDTIEQYALVADAHAGLKMVDFARWSEPSLAASWPYEGFINDLVIVDRIAYLATSSGLQTFSIQPNYIPEIQMVLDQPYLPAHEHEWVDIATSFSDLNGWQDIARVALLIGPDMSEAGACYAMYDIESDLIALVSDDGSALVGQAHPGQVVLLANNQVALDCSNTVVSGDGTRLDITWRLRFAEKLLGPNKAHLHVTDIDGATSGWRRIQGIDLTTSPYAASPYHSVLHPGEHQAFALTYHGRDSWQSIDRAEWMLRTDDESEPAFHAAYDRDNNLLVLLDDSGNTLASGTPGEQRSIENDLAIVDLGLCETAQLSETLTVTWNIAFKSAFSGRQRTLYMRSLLNEPFPARWAMVGDCLVNQAPAWGRVTPKEVSVEAGQWITVETTFVDPDGWEHIHDGLVLINHGLEGERGCYMRVTNAPDGATITLYDDTGRQVMAQGKPGQDRVIENSQAAIDLTRTKVVGENDTLAVTWPLQFKEPFVGTHYVHLWSRDRAQAVSGWKTGGRIEILPKESAPRPGADGQSLTAETPPGDIIIPPYRPGPMAEPQEGEVHILDQDGPNRRQ